MKGTFVSLNTKVKSELGYYPSIYNPTANENEIIKSKLKEYTNYTEVM